MSKTELVSNPVGPIVNLGWVLIRNGDVLLCSKITWDSLIWCLMLWCLPYSENQVVISNVLFHSYLLVVKFSNLTNIHFNWVAQPPTRKLLMNPVLPFGSIWSIPSGWWDLFESFTLTAASRAFFSEPGIPENQDAPKRPWSLVEVLQKLSNFSGIWVCLTNFDIQRFQEIVLHLCLF